MTLAANILDLARERTLRITTAESCTGGLIGAEFTDIPGSSDVYDRGFITYSNTAKTEMLGVPEALLTAHGAVSPEVAGVMAEGALTHSSAQLSVAVTGIAGPGGGSSQKPVGLVYIASAMAGRTTLIRRHFITGDRQQIRHEAKMRALDLLLTQLAV